MSRHFNETWTPDQTDRLCDVIADGGSFADAARVLGVSKNAALSRFERVKKALGPQAV